jgi:hypothetical protein
MMSLLGIFPSAYIYSETESGKRNLPSAYIYIGGKRKTEKEIPIKTLKKSLLEKASEAVRLLARRKISSLLLGLPSFSLLGGGVGVVSFPYIILCERRFKE